MRLFRAVSVINSKENTRTFRHGMNPTTENQSTVDSTARVSNPHIQVTRTLHIGKVRSERSGFRTAFGGGLFALVTRKYPKRRRGERESSKGSPVPVGPSKHQDNSESIDVSVTPRWQKQQVGVTDAEDKSNSRLARLDSHRHDGCGLDAALPLSGGVRGCKPETPTARDSTP